MATNLIPLESLFNSLLNGATFLRKMYFWHDNRATEFGYVGWAHKKLAKSSLPIRNREFCYWHWFDVIYWIGLVKSEKNRHIGNFTIHSFTKQGPQWHVEEPSTATSTTAWHLLHKPVTSLVTHCCVMTSHSSSIIGLQSANVVVLVTLAQTARPSSFHKWGWGQDCRKAIPSSPLVPTTLLCGDEYCHLGG